MPEVDPYAEHEADEQLLAALILAGALAALRRLPMRIDGQATSGIIRRRNADALIDSTWWREAWSGVDEKAATIASRISRRTLYDSGLNLEEVARQRAAQAVISFERDTAAGLRAALPRLPRDLAPRDLVDALAARLGPTERQLNGRRGINRWAARARRDGMVEGEITRQVARRARNAGRQRAEIWASNATVREVAESQSAVLAEAGRLVYSWNPDDEDSREDHAAHYRFTLAHPTPAGEPWADGAPLGGLPPYGPRCRCGIRDAGSALVNPDRGLP